MAFNQEYTNRYKAEGFFKHVEWSSDRGLLVKVYDNESNQKRRCATFESGTFDIEYDQQFRGHRQFYLSRQDSVKFMLNMGMRVTEIADVFRKVDGKQIVQRYV